MSSEFSPNLTDDILRKIIGHSRTSIGKLRRVSKAWKELVEEEFTNLSHLPALEEIEIAPVEDEPSSIVVELKIKKAYGFVLRSFRKFGFWEVPSVDRELVAVQTDLELADLLNERSVLLATPKSIKRVVIREMEGRSKHLVDYFRNIQFEELCFDEVVLTPEYSQEIITLIREWHATKVSFEFRTHTLPQRNEFLIHISEMVDAMRIRQVYSTNYVFGGPQWLDLLSEMLDNRVSKVEIDLDDTTAVAYYNELRGFAERLDQSGKQPWIVMNAFFAKHSRGFSFDHTSNDVMLKVRYNKSNIRQCLIDLRHQSRAKEAW